MKVFNLSWEQCYTTEGKFENLEKPIVFCEDHAVQIMNWLIEVNHWEITPEMKASIKEVVRKGTVFETPRFVLQFIGTEVMRDCVDADIHAKIVFKKIKVEGIEKAVISDARFENERRITREEGGRMVYKPVNPVNYFFNDLSPEEYEKVIEISSRPTQSM